MCKCIYSASPTVCFDNASFQARSTIELQAKKENHLNTIKASWWITNLLYFFKNKYTIYAERQKGRCIMEITSRSFNYATRKYEDWGVDDSGNVFFQVVPTQLELDLPPPTPPDPGDPSPLPQLDD